jgi:putative transposase
VADRHHRTPHRSVPKFAHALVDNGLRGLIGGVGACGDNEAMESFFALLQRQRWSTRAQLGLAIVTCALAASMRLDQFECFVMSPLEVRQATGPGKRCVLNTGVCPGSPYGE